MDHNITGIILAGGKSSRMDEDKAFIPFSGKPLIEIMINKLTQIYAELIIITNKPRFYEKYGLKTHPDILKGRGPLGGIYTGLITSKDKYNFIAACDMPFLNLDLVRYMIKEIDDYDAVIPEYNGRLQPLCGIYSKNCIIPIESTLSANNLKVTDLLQHVEVKLISEEEVKRLDPEGLSFTNINTKKDYQCILQSLSAK